MKSRIWISTICAMAWMTSALNAQPYRPQVGQPHEDFTLPRIDTREAVSLSDYRGQKVLLIQFASW